MVHQSFGFLMNATQNFTVFSWGGFILAVLLFSSCKNEIATINEVLDTDLHAEVAYDVEILYSDSALVKVKVEAPVMEREQRSGRLVENFKDGAYAEFFNTHGKLVSWIESDRAIRNDVEKKIYLYENVILINIEGDTLKTEELIWDERKGTIYNNRFFRFSNANEVIYGFKFSSNQEFTEYSFSRGAGIIDSEMLSGER